MLTRISNQKGSNSGGFFQDEEANKFYVKFYSNTDQTYAECLANAVYNLVGISAPKSYIGQVEGNIGLISPVVSGSALGCNFSKETAIEICKGFLVDAFLANYDVIGLVNDNILVDNGIVTRIDNGSSFMFRAQGALKPYKTLNRINELESFFNLGQYPQIFRRAGIKSITDFNLRPMALKILEATKNVDAPREFMHMIEGRREHLKELCG